MTLPRIKLIRNPYVGKWACESDGSWPGYGATPAQAYLNWAERQGLKFRVGRAAVLQDRADQARAKRVADALNAPWPEPVVVVKPNHPTRSKWHMFFCRVFGFK